MEIHQEIDNIILHVICAFRAGDQTMSALAAQTELRDAAYADLCVFEAFVGAETLRLKCELDAKRLALRRLESSVALEARVRPMFAEYPQVTLTVGERGHIVISAPSTNVVMSLWVNGRDWMACMCVKCFDTCQQFFHYPDGDKRPAGFAPLTHVQLWGNTKKARDHDKHHYVQWVDFMQYGQEETMSIERFLHFVHAGVQVTPTCLDARRGE